MAPSQSVGVVHAEVPRIETWEQMALSDAASETSQSYALLSQLENILRGVEWTREPGHGWVRAKRLEAPTASERELNPDDVFGDVEVMRFPSQPGATNFAYCVRETGVFAGLQLTVESDGKVSLHPSAYGTLPPDEIVKILSDRVEVKNFLEREPVL